jgi:putative ABC transport system substrate-binding protein
MIAHINRRETITLLGGAAAWPLAARAQQGDRVRRIGVLMSGDENDPLGKTDVSAFTQALAGLGWADGRNLRMELRWGRGDINRIRALAQELVGLQPDIILTGGTPGDHPFASPFPTLLPPPIPTVFLVHKDS